VPVQLKTAHYKWVSFWQLSSRSEVRWEVGVTSFALQHQLHAAACGVLSAVLKGAKPADLPVQPSVKVEFVLNLKNGEVDAAWLSAVAAIAASSPSATA
jgi:hypothetical protein